MKLGACHCEGGAVPCRPGSCQRYGPVTAMLIFPPGVPVPGMPPPGRLYDAEDGTLTQV